jgi:hypothetical protein
VCGMLHVWGDATCIQHYSLKTSRDWTTLETDVSVRIILKCILKKSGVVVWTGFR